MNIRKSFYLFLSLSLANPNQLLAQEFKEPSVEVLTFLNAETLNYLNSNTKIPQNGKDCNEKMAVGISLKVNNYRTSDNKISSKNKKPDTGKNEITCFCDNPYRKDEEEGLSNFLVGKDRKSEIRLNSGNDNFLHGMLMVTPMSHLDGDDRGRTFSGSVDYSLIGDKGELKISVDSTGFSRLDPKNGNINKSAEGKHYLNFRERNSLDISLTRNFNQTKQQSNYFIGKFNYTNETDEGRLSRKTQEWWHQFGRDSLGIKNIQYEYVKNDEDGNTISLMLGVGHTYLSDIRNWRCQTRAEALVGLSTNVSRITNAEVRSKISGAISHKALPWVSLSAWLEASNGFKGSIYEGGLELSLEKKMFGVQMKPFIGVERHVGGYDKKFGSPGGRANEIYHVLGVTIIY